MISTLIILQQAIENLINPIDGGSLDKAVQEVLHACEQVYKDAISRYRQYKKAGMAKLAFRQYHRQLLLLQGTLFSFVSATQSDVLAPAVHAVNQLLEDHERIYAEHIDPTTPLPFPYLQRLQENVQQHLPGILAQLAAKGIASLYLKEIAYSMDSLFHADKLPAACYHHRSYITLLLDALKQLAADKRQKDWQQRFMQIIIKYNFNYMGFFNRWREQQDLLLEQVIIEEKTGDFFRTNKRALRHFHPLADMAYDFQNVSLLTHMTDYLSEQKHDLKEMQREAELAQPTAFHTNLNSLEMAVDFHYKYKFGYYPYATKREAAKAYARAHRSKTGQYISPHTLEKLDKKELEAAATKMRSKLLKIAQQMKEDFNL